MKVLKYILLTYLLVSFLGCTNHPKIENEESIIAESKVKYTCPMHPQIIEDHPGSCPICGMDLVKVKVQQKSNGLVLSNAQIKLANIKTQKIGSDDFEDTKLINAQIVINPLNTAIVSSKFTGRIDRLYIQEAGVKVTKGQAIYKIYSEELLILQKDYILNAKQQKAFPEEIIYNALLKASKNKLKLYGYSDKQIRELLNTTQNNPYIIVYAPIGGVISEINLSEGQYIGEGTPVFKIENFDQLWIEAAIYPSEVSEVKIGKVVNIQISGFENENIKSKIEFISPQLDSKSQIITIRSSINNSENKFQPGMQANLSLSYINKKNVVSLPNEAVIRNQNGDHVWVKTAENNFEYRIVEIGAENESSVIIKTGLKIGDEVVTSGAYLLTSEFILKKGGDFMAGVNL